MTDTPISIGQVGIGGFGKHVLSCIRKLESQPNPLLKLTAVCEPMQAANAAAIAALRAEGITVVSDFDEMLKLPVQSLWLPVPIPLHRSFSCRAMEAGKWVICEKPAAGTIQDIDAMISLRDQVGGKIAIGFQDIHEPSVPQIKAELSSIGPVERVTVVCCWPRGTDYFGRNNWAGRIRTGDTWVLDSPCMNAMAHYLMLPLFLLGRQPAEAATPARVSAELYRARDIESADTCALRVQTAEGPSALFLMTHACADNFGPQMVFYGRKGRCHLTATEARFEFTAGSTKTIKRQLDHTRSAEAALSCWSGREPGRVVASLETARKQVQVVNAAFDATPVYDLPPVAYTIKEDAQRTLPVIPEIAETFIACAEKNQLPSEAGLSWAKPAGHLDLAGYTAFRGIHAGASLQCR